MVEKLGVKRKHIYRLHRDEEIDHKYGRPALLLNGRMTKSLVWTGTTKIDEFNKEEPLMLTLNNTPVYFYGNAIEVVQTKDLKTCWVNNETKQPYVLLPNQQEQVIKKFISMSKLKDPYLKINHLETSIEAKKIKEAKFKYKIKKFTEENKGLQSKNKQIQSENDKLKEENQKLKLERQRLTMENDTLTTENQILKSRVRTKNLEEYEHE